jgi:hypothetical protein
MSIFSYHLAEVSLFTSLKLLLNSKNKATVNGLMFSETMTCMTLGSPILSPSRILLKEIVLFAQWQDEESLNNFLLYHPHGKIFNTGWHIRMEFIRQWGHLNNLDKLPSPPDLKTNTETVVAVTLARMKFTQIPRFISWGRPVEKLVRDHSGKTIALASFRFPNTVSTFSIWKSEKEMLGMVHGKNSTPQPERHANAMKERDRKDFHYEFTTLRFKPLGEYGLWKGKNHYILN